MRLEGLQFNEHLIPDLKPDSLFRVVAPGEVTGIPDWFRTVYYYNNYLNRLQRIPVWIDTAAANMRKGMTQGVLASREVLRKHPYLKKEWCIRVLEEPLRRELQEGNRYRFWGKIEELEGRVLRVITLEDQITIHNAFPDRGFKL